MDLERTEVVVVDDGSTDETAATARQLLAPLPHHRVISLPVNRGKGAAVRTGVALARGPYVAYMDADMAIDPRAVPLLLDGLGSNDLAIGSRALADSMVEGTYAVRAVMGRLFNRLVTTGTGLGLHDTQCGFKAFRTPAARLLFHLVRHRPVRLRRRGAGPGPPAGAAHHRGAGAVEARARQHRPPPPRLGHHAGRRLPVALGSPGHAPGARRHRAGPGGRRSGRGVADRRRRMVGRRIDAARCWTGSARWWPTPWTGLRYRWCPRPSVTVLLPLVEPAEAAMVFSALRAEFDPPWRSRAGP